MITYNDLVNDIKSLGIKEGDTLFLRVSYKAIGKIEAGPKAFIDALLNVIGKEGTIILTAFPKTYNQLLRFFYKGKISSANNLMKPITGVMPIFALKYPSAMVSKKLLFPFVVIGKHAKYLTENHTNEKDGYWLLREATEKFNSKCLRIGGESLTGTTHLALTEMLRKYDYYQTRSFYGLYIKENDKISWQIKNNTTFCIKGFKKMYDQLIYPNVGKKEGKVGNGYAIVTEMKETLAKEREILFRNPIEILCEDSDCAICRTSFTFSDSTKGKYLINQLFRLKLGNIKFILLYILYGRKIQ
ncbi:MAG: AAC(3) family N-acetyltransferase [Prevotellaceae bacterium]|jgi:aminoglycoside N3'-acetyltransferase|nr:AAC(3) family N-acetyltransferase [Prevotellaceae bacterium]